MHKTFLKKTQSLINNHGERLIFMGRYQNPFFLMTLKSEAVITLCDVENENAETP